MDNKVRIFIIAILSLLPACDGSSGVVRIGLVGRSTSKTTFFCDPTKPLAGKIDTAPIVRITNTSRQDPEEVLLFLPPVSQDLEYRVQDSFGNPIPLRGEEELDGDRLQRQKFVVLKSGESVDIVISAIRCFIDCVEFPLVAQKRKDTRTDQKLGVCVTGDAHDSVGVGKYK